MTLIKRFVVILFSVLFVFLIGCGGDSNTSSSSGGGSPPPKEPTFTPHESAYGIADRYTKNSEKFVVFSNGGSEDFHWADGYSNGYPFNCVWKKSSAIITDGVMSMSVAKEGDGYTGAEYRSRDTFSYGFYSVCMKAADCSGVISSFFTYTNRPVWDEIDIEFLGKDTTRVQFNYYTKGDGEHEFLLDLGFDGAEDFHEYAFDWQQDSITWYVDGKAVYRATENIPSNPMQIMMNVWNCQGADAWSGPFDPTRLPATAQYKWIGYAPSY